MKDRLEFDRNKCIEVRRFNFEEQPYVRFELRKDQQ